MKLFKHGALFIFFFAFWPLLYAASSYFLLGVVDDVVIHEFYSFLPLGLISGLVVKMPLLTRRYCQCFLWGSIGFLVGSPIAYIASLYGALVLPPWLAASLLGGIPIIAFTYTGYKVGEKIKGDAVAYSY